MIILGFFRISLKEVVRHPVFDGHLKKGHLRYFRFKLTLFLDITGKKTIVNSYKMANELTKRPHIPSNKNIIGPSTEPSPLNTKTLSVRLKRYVPIVCCDLTLAPCLNLMLK